MMCSCFGWEIPCHNLITKYMGGVDKLYQYLAYHNMLCKNCPILKINMENYFLLQPRHNVISPKMHGLWTGLHKCSDCPLLPDLCPTLESNCHSSWHAAHFNQLRSLWVTRNRRKFCQRNQQFLSLSFTEVMRGRGQPWNTVESSAGSSTRTTCTPEGLFTRKSERSSSTWTTRALVVNPDYSHTGAVVHVAQSKGHSPGLLTHWRGCPCGTVKGPFTRTTHTLEGLSMWHSQRAIHLDYSRMHMNWWGNDS